RKMAVHEHDYARGEYMRGLSTARDWQPRNREAAEDAIDQLYQGFIERVLDSRKLPRPELVARAKGIPWLGDDAAEYKLVDGIGGLAEAIAAARGLGGVPADEKISL